MQERFCNICGIKLQSANPTAAGYVPSRVLLGTSQSVCQKCHRARIAAVPAGRNEEVASGGVRRVLEKADLSLLIIDITDFEGTFSKRLLRHCGRKLMLVVNKIDLLPGRTSRGDVLAWVTKRLADAHVTTQGVFLVSIQKGIGISTLWDAVIKELNGQGTVTVVGVEGVGKTALVNSWLEYNKAQEAAKKKTRRKSKRTTSDDMPKSAVAIAQLDENVGVEPIPLPPPEPAVEQEILSQVQIAEDQTHPSEIEFEPITIIEQPTLFDLLSSPEPDTTINDVTVAEPAPPQVPEQEHDHVLEQQEDETQPDVTPQGRASAPMSIDDVDDSPTPNAAGNSTVKAVSPKAKKRRRAYATRRRAQKPDIVAHAANTSASDSTATEVTIPVPLPISVPIPAPVPAVSGITQTVPESGALPQQAADAKQEPKSKVKPKRRRRKSKKTAEKIVAQPVVAVDLTSDAAKAASTPTKTKKGKSAKKAKRAAKPTRVVSEPPVVEVIATQSETVGLKPKSSRRRSRRRRAPKLVPIVTPQVVTPTVASEVKPSSTEHEPVISAKDTGQVESVPSGRAVAAKGKAQTKQDVAPKPETIDIKVIDTLSVPARGRMRDSLCAQCTQALSIQKPLRSRVLRLKAGQAAVFAGLVAISALEVAGEDGAASLLVYMPPSITVQRVSSMTIDDFLRRENQPWRMDVCANCTEHLLKGGWEETEMSVDALHDLALHGMGWITARKSMVTLRVLVPAGMLASMRPRLVGAKA